MQGRKSHTLRRYTKRLEYHIPKWYDKFHFLIPSVPRLTSLKLFFDDERRNKEVETLGVTFHHTPDGIENQVFEKGLTEWKKRHPALVVEDAEASVQEE
ncbi:hypothetical protein PILCRDRAFT_16887 [Piloderma croceum F 1598]|uniref:Uncharacterized protein n=1 Tax=Piloderma croceum (strain F 1598) TaxID=765440 RepID=A0A0C3EUZ9_PILCF|nr:hypothetical protein PILCRDRAFT_16887 [Piloderma croceum F 1598]